MGNFQCNLLFFIDLRRKWQEGVHLFCFLPPAGVGETAGFLRAGLGTSSRLLAVEGWTTLIMIASPGGGFPFYSSILRRMGVIICKAACSQEEPGVGFWRQLSNLNRKATGTSWIKCSKLAPLRGIAS
jgi:hypothetical protein